MLLRNKDRENLIQIFSEVTTPIAVWAYGSRVNGDAHSGSDLDLVIRTKTLDPLPFEIYTDLCENIRESNIPILVELRDWARLPEIFHQSILRRYEVLFESEDCLEDLKLHDKLKKNNEPSIPPGEARRIIEIKRKSN